MYGHVITKFFGMGRFIRLWGSTHARASRARGVPLKFTTKKMGIFKVRPVYGKNVYRSIYNSKTLCLEGS